MSIRRSPSRRRSQSGQAAVETALMVIPLLMLLLAIIDFSLAIFVMDTLQYAARQGVRFAVTSQVTVLPGPPPVVLGQDASIRGAVRAAALGLLDHIPDEQIPINYYSYNATTSTWQASGANVGGNLVKVGVTGFSWLWMLPGTNSASTRNGSSALSITAASADIMEGCPLTGCASRN